MRGKRDMCGSGFGLSARSQEPRMAYFSPGRGRRRHVVIGYFRSRK